MYISIENKSLKFYGVHELAMSEKISKKKWLQEERAMNTGNLQQNYSSFINHNSIKTYIIAISHAKLFAWTNSIIHLNGFSGICGEFGDEHFFNQVALSYLHISWRNPFKWQSQRIDFVKLIFQFYI